MADEGIAKCGFLRTMVPTIAHVSRAVWAVLFNVEVMRTSELGSPGILNVSFHSFTKTDLFCDGWSAWRLNYLCRFTMLLSLRLIFENFLLDFTSIKVLSTARFKKYTQTPVPFSSIPVLSLLYSSTTYRQHICRKWMWLIHKIALRDRFDFFFCSRLLQPIASL